MVEINSKVDNYRPLAWIAAIAFFMQSLDATILNTALPAISASLGESALEMQMAVISYSLTVAAIIPLSGWMADRFGTLRVFQFSVFIFGLGSLACAMSSNLTMLIASRVLQGVGGALMMPVARLAIIRNVQKTHLISAWNLMATAGLIGPILGPILGGWFVTNMTWHWIFFINIPIALLGIIIANKYMMNSYGELSRLDWMGFLLFASGLVALTFGLDVIAEDIAQKENAFSLIGGGVGLLVIYVFYASRIENALIPLSLWKVRTFSLGMLGNLFVRMAGSGVPFLLPLMLQIAFHYDAQTAGFMIAPIALSSILVKRIATSLLHKFGYKKMLIADAIFMAGAIATMSLLNESTSLWLYVPVVMWYGACMSLMFTAVNTLTISELSDKQASAGSTVLSMMQQVGIGLGIAVSSVILALWRAHLGNEQADLANAFSHTFLISSCFGVILAFIMSFLHKNDGDNLRQKTK